MLSKLEMLEYWKNDKGCYSCSPDFEDLIIKYPSLGRAFMQLRSTKEFLDYTVNRLIEEESNNEIS